MQFRLPIEVGHVSHKQLPPHSHSAHAEHVLSLTVNGHLRIEHGETLDIYPGTLTLVPAGAPHRLLQATDVEVWWVAFCANCLQLPESHPLMLPFRQIRLGALPLFHLSSARQFYVLEHMRELQWEAEQHAPESFDITRSLLILLLKEVSRVSAGLHPRQNTDLLVVAALDFIQQHSLTPISLRQVAEAVHRSPAYVASRVKAVTGYTVGEWISRARLSEACSRLVHTDQKVESIAESVGWGDVTHFIRQFKKLHGQTPAAWRKAQHMQQHLSRQEQDNSGEHH